MEETMKSIKGFQKEYRWLSNFWPAEVEYERVVYPSVEVAYQAAKAVTGEKWKFNNISSPGAAKKLGKTVQKVPNWNLKKINVMLLLVRQKFMNHEDLKQKLLATGNAYLEETNSWYDTFWGVCNREGTNFLGFILMIVRHELKGKEAK